MILVGRNVILLHVCERKKLCWQGSWKKFLRFKKEISVCICCSKLVIMQGENYSGKKALKIVIEGILQVT